MYFKLCFYPDFIGAGIGINGEGSKGSARVAHIGEAELKVEGLLNFTDLNILPGHKTVSGIKLTATGDNKLVSYNFIWKGINSLNTPLNYTVYKTSVNVDVVPSCEAKTKVENGKQYLNEECAISNVASLGSPVATGTIETSTTEAKVVLVEDEMVNAAPTGTVVYYYVVLEYPNLESNQNADLNGGFEGVVTVEESDMKPDVNIMAVYVKDPDATDYTKVDDIPSKDPKVSFNASKSNCTNSATPIWNSDSWNITIDNLTKSGTSCYLYFDEQEGTPVDDIIAGGTATDDSMFSGTSGNGVYTWTKGDYSSGSQTIKYYRGNVNNNWVVFGKDGDNYIWWRIIRNNSNGSIRMIYAGTSASKTNAPATTGSGTQLGTKAFNTSYNNNMYVGFKYTNNQVHGNGTNSTILGAENSTDKTTLYGWYNQTLAKSADYSGKIDLDAGFCNDRGPSTSSSSLNGSGGTGTTTTYYAAYIRLITNKAPSLLCASTSDIFKTPVGLITADEVSMGGMVVDSSKTNTSSYLYTNSHYWTMSPYRFNGSSASVFYVRSAGFLGNDNVSNTNGVRPVVNLKSDTLFVAGGAGTNTNPYVVIGT